MLRELESLLRTVFYRALCKVCEYLCTHLILLEFDVVMVMGNIYYCKYLWISVQLCLKIILFVHSGWWKDLAAAALSPAGSRHAELYQLRAGLEQRRGEIGDKNHSVESVSWELSVSDHSLKVPGRHIFGWLIPPPPPLFYLFCCL